MYFPQERGFTRIIRPAMVCASLFAPVAGAAVLHEQVPPDVDTFMVADTDPSGSVGKSSDGFVLAADSFITGFSWRGGYFFSNTPMEDDLTIEFLLDNNGGPGSTLAVFDVGADADRTFAGSPVLNCCDLYDYSYTLPSALAVAAGTYWVVIYNNTSNDPDDTWGWAVDTQTFDPLARNNYTHYYTVFGDTAAVPLPATLPLFAAALGLLGISRSRTRQRG